MIDDALRQSRKSTLGEALKTTPPPVAAPLPTGKPPAPAPMQTPEQMVADPSKILASKDPTQIGAAAQQIKIRSAEEDAAAKNLQAQQAVTQEKTRGDLMRESMEEKKKATEQHQKDLQESSPFAPTPESKGDLASLFSLLSVAAFSSGGEGRYAGMQALAGLTGAMKGYQAGRKDVFAQDVKKFEEGLKVLKAHNEKVDKIYKDALDLYATNKELGEQKMRELIAADNTGIVSRLARSGLFGKIGEVFDTQAKAVTHAQEIVNKRKHDFALVDRRLAGEKAIAGMRLERKDEKALQAIGPAMRNIAENYPEGTAQSLVGASPDDKKRVQGSFRAVQESEQVADFVAKNKGAVGALAVVKNILKIDAINSIKNEDENVAAQQKSQLVDGAIDKAAASGKISAQDAQDAKILQKKLFGLALSDVQGSGQRGSVYLDKQFQNLYDQASRQDTLLKIIKERAKENNSNLKIYKLNVERTIIQNNSRCWSLMTLKNILKIEPLQQQRFQRQNM